MTEFSTPLEIKTALHQILRDEIGALDNCVLLEYSPTANVGTHWLWVSALLCLTDVVAAQVSYTASIHNFSAQAMARRVNRAPIFIKGGYLGDFWSNKGSNRLSFCEHIVSRFTDRPIFILPQSISFADSERLKIIADIFNAHPQLTIFTRENYSHARVVEYFPQCRVVLAPDTVFHLGDMPGLSLKIKPSSSILYLCRQDWVSDRDFSPTALGIPNLVVSEWLSWQRMFQFPVYIPGFNWLIRGLWQWRLAIPREWLARLWWKRSLSYTPRLRAIHRGHFHLHSLDMMYTSIRQLSSYPLVITNRLHGHIICLLLEIPHVLIPGPYQKMEAFYQTWTAHIPFCRFVQDPKQVKFAVAELLEKFPRTN